MDTKLAVDYVASKFQYKYDPRFLDYWSIMFEENNQMHGDCDDFALTSIWKICDENFFKFLLNVFILHRYRIYFAITPTKEMHAVGYANGYYFDNWSNRALPRDEFLEKTNHKIYFFWPSPFMIMPLMLGLLLRIIRKNT